MTAAASVSPAIACAGDAIYLLSFSLSQHPIRSCSSRRGGASSGPCHKGHLILKLRTYQATLKIAWNDLYCMSSCLSFTKQESPTCFLSLAGSLDRLYPKDGGHRLLLRPLGIHAWVLPTRLLGVYILVLPGSSLGVWAPVLPPGHQVSRLAESEALPHSS